MSLGLKGLNMLFTSLIQALELKPGNLAVQEQLAFLKEKQRQQDAALSKALGAMFGCT